MTVVFMCIQSLRREGPISIKQYRVTQCSVRISQVFGYFHQQHNHSISSVSSEKTLHPKSHTPDRLTFESASATLLKHELLFKAEKL